jgi:hypothetical protein
MPKGVSNQPPRDGLRERFRKGPRRQFTLKLLMRPARALIKLAIEINLPINETVDRLVHEEWARRGRNVESDPAFDPPVTKAAE